MAIIIVEVKVSIVKSDPMRHSSKLDKPKRHFTKIGKWSLSKNSFIVIVRLDRTIHNLLKRLDSPIKSGNDSLLKS